MIQQPMDHREGQRADIGLEHIDLLLHERVTLRLGGVALLLYRLQFPEQVGDDVLAIAVFMPLHVAAARGLEVPSNIARRTAGIDTGTVVHRAALGARALQQAEDHGVEVDEQLVVCRLIESHLYGDELRGIGARAGSGAARYVRHIAAVREEVELQLLDYAFERGGDVVAGIGMEAPLIAVIFPAGGVGGHRGGGGFRAALFGSGGSLSRGRTLRLRPFADVRILTAQRRYERTGPVAAEHPAEQTSEVEDAEVLYQPVDAGDLSNIRQSAEISGVLDIAAGHDSVTVHLHARTEEYVKFGLPAVMRDLKVQSRHQTVLAAPLVIAEITRRIHAGKNRLAEQINRTVRARIRIVAEACRVDEAELAAHTEIQVEPRGVEYVLQHGHDARRIGHGKPAVAFADFFDHFLDLGVGDETAESEFDVVYRELQARARFVEDRVDGEGLDARVAEVELEAERLDVGDVARDLAADHAEEEFDDALFEFDADGVVGEVDGEAEAADVEPAFGAFGRAFGAFRAFRGLVRCRGAFRHDIIDAARRAAEQTRYAGQLDRAEAEAAEVDIDGIRERARGVRAKSVVVAALAQPRRAEIVRLEQAAVEVGQADIQD